MPQGSWKFSDKASFGAMIWQCVSVSREIGMTLTDFLALPEDEKAIQMVFSQIKNKIEQVSAQEQRDKAKKK